MSQAPASPRRALIVIDVQNEYFEGGGLPIEFPPVSQSLPNITSAMDAARAAGTPVVVVQHRAPQGAPVFQADKPGGQLHTEVAQRPHDHLITKSQPSVFAGTDFAEWLDSKGIDTLTIAGFMTQNCNASTVYEAMHRGLQVEFLSDATGAPRFENAAGKVTAEEMHRVFCVTFHSNFAAVSTTAAWIDALHGGKALAKDNVVMSSRRARGLA